ncbi:MAG: acylphosphatase [Candidatus Promineifilaceae bacterium]
MKQIQATVHGRVQGVFFRQTTRSEAQKFGLKGWVKNERNGTVSVTAIGPEEVLKQFIEYLHQGPPGAQVSRVEVAWSEAEQSFKGFDVRW